MKKNKAYDTKIRGLKVRIYNDRFKIFNTYQIKNKEKMNIILELIMNKTKTNRKMNSLIRQWKAYNNFYELGLFRKKTKTITFRSNTNLLENAFYLIFGF